MLAAPALASPAAAQSMARESCAVTIVRAPDDVRSVVEQWVQAEPKCSVKLELRIVPTEGGLYLLARDEHGRLRERVVPDAQSAGVIVASWVAADSNAPTPYDVSHPAPAPEAPAVAPMPPVAPPAPVFAPGEGAGPSAVPVIDKPADVAQVTNPERPRYFALGLLANVSDAGGGGIRGEWDVKHKSWAALGLAASISGTSITYDDGYSTYGYVETFDAKLLGYIGTTGRSGKWHLRASAGAGAVYTQAAANSSSGYQEAGGLFPTGELTVSVGRELGKNWAVYAGPVVSVYLQSLNLQSMSPYDSAVTLDRPLEAMMFISMRRRL
jgi:hypothetical protein